MYFFQAGYTTCTYDNREWLSLKMLQWEVNPEGNGSTQVKSSMTLYWLNLINWRIKISKTINLGPNPATYFHRNNFIDFSHSTLKHKCYLAISNLIFLAIVPKSLFAKGFRIWIKPENSDGINQVEKWNLVGDTNIHFSNKLQKVWDEILRSILGTT